VFVQLATLFFSCKTENKIQKLNINASGSVKNPVDIRLGSFFPAGWSLDYVDTARTNINYHFVPGEMLSIGRDTSIFLFYPDSIFVDYRFEKPIFYSTNLENTKYNQFFNSLYSSLLPIYTANQMFFSDKIDSMIENENYIDNYLSKSDSLINEQVIQLCNKYQFDKSSRFDLLQYVLQTQSLSSSYFFVGFCLSKLDSLGMLNTRLQYYIDKINQQHVSIFSQKTISYLTERIAYRLTKQSIFRFKNKDDLRNYYSAIQPYFPKGSTSYDYLISSIEEHAKKKNIKLRGLNLRPLKQDAKKSIFKKYVENKYGDKSDNLKDSPKDMNLYNTQLNSFDLSKLISQYKNKPLLIDFWASWCGPCIDKMSETFEFKKKYHDLNVIFISIDKSQDAWELFLYEHDMMGIEQYRRNFYNQDSIFSQIKEIPKYGLLNKDGHLELFDELSDSLVTKYLKLY
jgi:thiol-disulfide isomerase/thioredoxin